MGRMRVVTSDLDDLRREVDRLDNAVVDLLVERLTLVERIAILKDDRQDGRIALRPAREAVILRRLVARAGDGFPAAELIRMWRELLAATTRQQTPFAVAAHVPPDQPGLWDIARDHFGSSTPVRRVASPAHALRSLADGSAQVAVLPEPGEQEPWWRALVTPGDAPLRIVARLPLADLQHPREPVSAVAVARLDQELSGDDLTLLVLEARAALSRATLLEALARAGLLPRCLATVREPETGSALHLVEVAGLLGPGEPALADALAPIRHQILRATPIGGYPRPLSITASG